MENGNPALENISAAALAKGALEIERGEPCEILPLLARGGTAGGAMPKALVLLYSDGSLRVGEPTADGGLPGILKLDLSAGRVRLLDANRRSPKWPAVPVCAWRKRD